MNKTRVLEKMFDAINDKVKQNWNDGTNVTHDIATIINLVELSGCIDEWQANQLFQEANNGYLLTYSFLIAINVL